jgi:hypothetical protein
MILAPIPGPGLRAVVQRAALPEGPKDGAGDLTTTRTGKSRGPPGRGSLDHHMELSGRR